MAVQLGTPQDHAGQPCSGSPETVDDSFFNQHGQSVEVFDINSIWTDGVEGGWLYRGNDGKTYIQYNYADRQVYSWAVGSGIAVGSSSPGGYSGIKDYKGGGIGEGMVPPGGQVEKCYQKGSYLGASFG